VPAASFGLFFYPENGSSTSSEKSVNFYNTIGHRIPEDAFFIAADERTSNLTHNKLLGKFYEKTPFGDFNVNRLK
jgi:hypothetical protein